MYLSYLSYFISVSLDPPCSLYEALHKVATSHISRICADWQSSTEVVGFFSPTK